MQFDGVPEGVREFCECEREGCGWRTGPAVPGIAEEWKVDGAGEPSGEEPANAVGSRGEQITSLEFMGEIRAAALRAVSYSTGHTFEQAWLGSINQKGIGLQLLAQLNAPPGARLAEGHSGAPRHDLVGTFYYAF